MSSHTYWCPLRWGDMDAQGHINNGAFLDYLQDARVDFLLNQPAPLAGLLGRGVLVISHQIEYLRPVVFTGAPLKINLWLDSMQGARFFLGYEIWDGDQPAARARTGLVPFDLATQSLRRLDAEERQALAPFLHPGPELRPLPKIRWTGVDHRYRFRVRWSDVDSYNHVNNVRFFDYLQEARIELLTSTANDLRTPEVGWVVRRQDIEYLKAIDFRLQPYEVRIVISAVGTTSFQLAAEIGDPDSGDLHATARTVVVAVDPASGRPQPLDGQLSDRLNTLRGHALI